MKIADKLDKILTKKKLSLAYSLYGGLYFTHNKKEKLDKIAVELNKCLGKYDIKAKKESPDKVKLFPIKGLGRQILSEYKEKYGNN